MYNRGWDKLIKNNECYRYEPKAGVEKEKHRATGLGFTQLAFDHDEECMIVADSKDHLHCVELPVHNAAMYAKRLGKVGRATLLSFNPICKGEVLIGLDTGDIKVWKLRTGVMDEFCLLSGHKLPPTHISFYKSHCVTCSRNEVAIWCLRTYSRAHRLNVSGGVNAIVRKAAFSNAGHIVVLYHNDTMQAWTLERLDVDTKIDAKALGTRYIRDFAFTRDGRAMITAGARGVSVLSTYDWSLLTGLSFPRDFEAKLLSVVPYPLDGGANRIVALLSSRRTLHFCDVNTSRFLETPDRPVDEIKKFAVSSAGRYLAYIDQTGCLNVTSADKMMISDKRPKRSLEPRKLHAHGISDHLECIERSIKRELNTKRLTSILTEFGEYPEKYRALIWSTVLKLPANRSAYLALASKVTRGGFAMATVKNHPLADRSKASLLAMTTDCLLQWCPLLAQSPFLPNLVFPFLVVFRKDPLLAFELILSVLLNYCQNWFEYHPLPPLNVLGIIENILLEVDPALLDIFCEHEITSGEYAWPLLHTAMSEVLSGDEWLILWDHLITFRKPSLLLMCVVAYSICSRENIISLIKLPGDIKAFYSTQGHVRAKDLLKIAKRLDRELPERVHPNRYLRDELLSLNRTGPYSLFILKEYPKFLIENSCIADTERCKERERHLQEHDRKIAEVAEERRLRNEADAFAKQIHETRLSEVQKCFRKYINNLELKFDNLLENTGRERLYCQHLYKNTRSRERQACDECEGIENKKLSNFTDVKENSKNCEKLRYDVTKLEYEVQSLLDSLRPGR